MSLDFILRVDRWGIKAVGNSQAIEDVLELAETILEIVPAERTEGDAGRCQ